MNANVEFLFSFHSIFGEQGATEPIGRMEVIDETPLHSRGNEGKITMALLETENIEREILRFDASILHKIC